MPVAVRRRARIIGHADSYGLGTTRYPPAGVASWREPLPSDRACGRHQLQPESACVGTSDGNQYARSRAVDLTRVSRVRFDTCSQPGEVLRPKIEPGERARTAADLERQDQSVSVGTPDVIQKTPRPQV